MPLIEMPMGDALCAIRRGDKPPKERVFPSREAADAYRVVRAWVRQRNPAGMTNAEVRQEMARRWPFLPWMAMRPVAFVKTAAKLLRDEL